jgi:hypothetical protein
MKNIQSLFKIVVLLKLILLIAAADSMVLAQAGQDRSAQARERAEQARQDRGAASDTLRERGEQARSQADTARTRGEEMRREAEHQRERGQEISRQAREDGRAFGQMTAEQARQQRIERAAELGSAETEGRMRADEARERIERARQNLENARTEGNISEQQYSERRSRIEAAEAKLAELEEKLNRGRELRRTAVEATGHE